MTIVGVLSDTHSYLNPSIEKFLSPADIIVHAGDIGNISVIDSLKKHADVKAVFGNIDGQDIRVSFPEYDIFSIDKVKTVLIHIGGTPKRYSSKAKELIELYNPDLFITGHSHILKVMYDKPNHLLYMNPGASGKFGSHRKVTALMFTVDVNQVKDLKVYEANRQSGIL